jgi:hypothetical protein
MITITTNVDDDVRRSFVFRHRLEVRAFQFILIHNVTYCYTEKKKLLPHVNVGTTKTVHEQITNLVVSRSTERKIWSKLGK